jgi:hypothetical protein
MILGFDYQTSDHRAELAELMAPADARQLIYGPTSGTPFYGAS